MTEREEIIARTEERMEGVVVCPACEGTGYGNRVRCGFCFGRGKVRLLGDDGAHMSVGPEKYVGEFPRRADS